MSQRRVSVAAHRNRIQSPSCGSWNISEKILEPLLTKCSYLVDSQKAFKSRFMIEGEKFNGEHHELISFDIKSMYPNINVTRTVSYILQTIFLGPRKYFTPEKDQRGYTLPITTKEEFKTFLLGVLRDYNYFECQTSVNKQLRVFWREKQILFFSRLSKKTGEKNIFFLPSFFDRRKIIFFSPVFF